MWDLIRYKKTIRAVSGEAASPSSWVRSSLGFTADSRQERILDTGSRRGILNCSRQWGKSTVTAAMAVHQACTVAGSLTLVVSPTARQSDELVRKASEFAQKLGIRRLQFPNGSRIVGLPGSEATVRGFSAVQLILVDEASRVSDELYRAVRPMLAVSGGKLWLMSTPFGKRGFFWETWEQGGPEWERVRATGEECERIPGEFLREERKVLGSRWYQQEYCCEFGEPMGGMFDSDVVEAALSDDFGEIF